MSGTRHTITRECVDRVDRVESVVRAPRSAPLAMALALASALLLVACGQDVLTGGSDGALGEWNGLHASLVIDKSGGAVEYDCAHGGFAGTIRSGRIGQFVAPGVFVREHGGPIRDGEPIDSLAAVYLGVVRGDELTLRMIVGTDTAGPYTLTRNGQVRLFKCL